MDKKIAKKTWTLKRIATYGGIAIFVVFVGYQFIFADRRQKLKIEKEKITISEVKRGVFQEFIPQTGILIPSRTIYLDAIEGGTIKRVVAESGSCRDRHALRRGNGGTCRLISSGRAGRRDPDGREPFAVERVV